MSINKQQYIFKDILSINPYKNVYFTSSSNFIKQTSSIEFSKEQFAISYINTKDLINAEIEISKNIPEEDLEDTIYTKAYDELALDQTIEYKIQYTQTISLSSDNNRHFHLFIVDPKDINTIFKNSIDKIKYIDEIVPAPLLIKPLYTKNLIINSHNTHCFIYIQENDAFITIYENEEFIYAKSIKFSLLDMHERFCELYGERVSYEDFFYFFSKENLRDTNSNYKQFFLRLYKELINNIGDILTYAKRAFEIEKFERIYIGTQLKTATKLDEMLEVELNIKTSEFNFDYGFSTNETYIDQLHILMHLYSRLDDSEKYNCNFTLNKRPPKFMKRESGKLIVFSLISFLLAFIYPATYWTLNYAQSVQERILTKEYNKIHTEKIFRQNSIKNKYKNKEKSLSLLNIEKQDYQKKKNTLTRIHKVKVDYPMKAKLIALLTKELNLFDVNINYIKYNEIKNKKTLLLNLIADNNMEITKLVKHLTSQYKRKFAFTIKSIELNKTTNKYFCQLKVNIL